MSRPRLLDICCCAGGASMGYHRAGFEVSGIDKEPQPRYPFPFMQGNALHFQRWDDYDAIHASPPCQLHSDLASMVTGDYEDLIEPIRTLLISTGKPYVIENVMGAPLVPTVILCGSMFGLGAGGRILKRHRQFESNFPIPQPVDACAGREVGGVYGDGGGGQMTRGWKFHAADSREAMGIDWMRRRELSESIPPAYTEHVGRALMAHVQAIGRAAA